MLERFSLLKYHFKTHRNGIHYVSIQVVFDEESEYFIISRASRHKKSVRAAKAPFSDSRSYKRLSPLDIEIAVTSVSVEIIG